MTEYASNNAAFAAAGARIVALSVDSAARSEAVRQQLALPFPILCDTTRAVVRAWGLYNPDEMGGIAVPAVFVISKDCRVRYRSVDDTLRRVPCAAILRIVRDGSAPTPRVRVSAGFGYFVRAILNGIRRGFKEP